MGSSAALVLFSIFILIGLTIEAKGRQEVGRTVWLPLFWMVICASRSVGQWLGVFGFVWQGGQGLSPESNLNGSPVDQLVLTIVIIWGIVIIVRREAGLRILKNNKALVVFTVYLGITVLWSDISLVSFRRWIRLLGSFVMAAVLVSEPKKWESIKSNFLRAAYLLIPLSLMLIKYFPEKGVLYTRYGNLMWTGVALVKNSLGHLCLVFLFYLVWNMIDKRKRKVETKSISLLYDLIIIIMCFWLLVGSGCAAALGTSLIVIAALIGLQASAVKNNFRRIGVLALVTTCVLLALQFSIGIIEPIVKSLGRNMTFTDRDAIWAAVVELGMRRPLLGYGYGGFFIGERADFVGITQAHNGYLEIFAEGGLVAIIMLGILVISVFKSIQRSGLGDYEHAILRLCFLIMVLLTNITESSLARERDLMTFVFYLVSMDSPAGENVEG